MIYLYEQWRICLLRPLIRPPRAIVATQWAAGRSSEPSCNTYRTEGMIARKRALILDCRSADRAVFHFILL